MKEMPKQTGISAQPFLTAKLARLNAAARCRIASTAKAAVSSSQVRSARLAATRWP